MRASFIRTHAFIVVTLALVVAPCAVSSARESPPPRRLGEQLAALAAAPFGLDRVALSFSDRPGHETRTESRRARWNLEHHRLVDVSEAEGEPSERYARYVYRVPRSARAVFRERSDQPWRELDPSVQLPAPFDLAPGIVRAARIAAGSMPLLAPGAEVTLELDVPTARDLLARHVPIDRVIGGGRLTVAREKTGDVWRFTATLDLRAPEAASSTATVTLWMGDGDGVLIGALPAEVAVALAIPMPRPRFFRAQPRAIDRFDSATREITTTLGIWFSDRDGGLGGNGELFDWRLESARWRTGSGEVVAAQEMPLVATPGEGAALSWRFVDLVAQGIEALEVELVLSMNLHPVRVQGRFERRTPPGEVPAWVGAGDLQVEIGEPPMGVKVRRVVER